MLIVAAHSRVFETNAPGPELTRRPTEQRAARPQCPQYQHAPENKAEKERDLPEAPELAVRKALIAEPEPSPLDDPHDAEIIADQRAGDDEHHRPEQQIYEGTLGRGFTTADCRRDE